MSDDLIVNLMKIYHENGDRRELREGLLQLIGGIPDFIVARMYEMLCKRDNSVKKESSKKYKDQEQRCEG